MRLNAGWPAAVLLLQSDETQAQGDRDLRHDRRCLQTAATAAGPGHPVPAQKVVALSGTGAHVQEAEERDHRRGEVAAAEPSAHGPPSQKWNVAIGRWPTVHPRLRRAQERRECVRTVNAWWG